MRPLTYQRAADAASAVDAVAGDPDAAFVAGGTNLVDHMKLGVATPGALVDVSALSAGGVEELPEGGVRVGAGVRNSDLAAHPLIRERYRMVSAALLAGASGQIRNVATTGGNLLQRTRCVYFQDVTTPCNKRVPGSGCSALAGYGRYNAVLGASEHCVAVHPSDLAVALVAADAHVHTVGPDGARRIAATGLHRLPGASPQHDTVLAHGELITSVDLPQLPMAVNSAYYKVRDRASYAFALVSVAACLDVRDGIIADIRVAFGGLAHAPWRAHTAEDTLRGAPAREEAFRAAADAELDSARPGADNAYKVPMAVNAMVATLRQLTPGET